MLSSFQFIKPHKIHSFFIVFSLSFHKTPQNLFVFYSKQPKNYPKSSILIFNPTLFFPFPKQSQPIIKERKKRRESSCVIPSLSCPIQKKAKQLFAFTFFRAQPFFSRTINVFCLAFLGLKDEC
jgi:hypothetical protein